MFFTLAQVRVSRLRYWVRTRKHFNVPDTFGPPRIASVSVAIVPSRGVAVGWPWLHLSFIWPFRLRRVAMRFVKLKKIKTVCERSFVRERKGWFKNKCSCRGFFICFWLGDSNHIFDFQAEFDIDWYDACFIVLSLKKLKEHSSSFQVWALFPCAQSFWKLICYSQNFRKSTGISNFHFSSSQSRVPLSSSLSMYLMPTFSIHLSMSLDMAIMVCS